MNETSATRHRGEMAYPAEIPGTVDCVYKTIGSIELKLWFFLPWGHRPDDRRAAALFFFGGIWEGGSPRHFRRHAAYLAERGMVGVVADFRVTKRHDCTVIESLRDARSAIRWLRAHAAEYGIDPSRIAVGGGSSGGHLAALTATHAHLDEAEEEPHSVSAMPDALLLFNPFLVLDDVPDRFTFADPGLGLREKMRLEELRTVSPYHRLRPGLPPTLILHGMKDDIAPYETIALFKEAMDRHGNRCELIAYEQHGHRFFNYGFFDNAPFYDTLAWMDRFLISLKFLRGPGRRVRHP